MCKQSGPWRSEVLYTILLGVVIVTTGFLSYTGHISSQATVAILSAALLQVGHLLAGQRWRNGNGNGGGSSSGGGGG